MSWGFDTYGNAAGQIASNAGLSQPIFFGLIQTESSWQPYAHASGSSATGFGQLLSGTAKQLGVDPNDPIQNLQGSATYLSQLLNRYGGNYFDALAAYHDGPGAIGQHGGYEYAAKVLNNAMGYLAKGASLIGVNLGGWTPGSSGTGATDPNAAQGGSFSSCGINPICYLQQWVASSKFFARLGLATLALIILAAAFYLMNRTEINSAVKTATIAA